MLSDEKLIDIEEDFMPHKETEGAPGKRSITESFKYDLISQYYCFKLIRGGDKKMGEIVAKVLKVMRASIEKRIEAMEKHGSLWDFVSRLSMERGDRDIIRLFNAANGVRNFYEDQMNREALSYKILRSSLN